MLQITHKELSTSEATMLVVIDPRVEAPASLISGVEYNTAVLLLDPLQDSIPQITTALTKGNYKTLHLVSHGTPGCLQLGKKNLTADNLSQYKQQLLEWGIEEILIYGCNVAAAPDLLRQLHCLTGANIAASSKEVGKGNWHLEWQTGKIRSQVAFNSQIRQEYQGTFGFEPQETFATGNAPQAVAIGDFDGDGDADDIVTANSGNISVLLADGAGGFTSSTLASSGFELAVGDFNEDGTDDIALANFSNVSILLSDGAGGFTSSNFNAGNGETGVAVGDFNNDDHLDLAVSNQNDQNVATFLGDGSGDFSASTSVSVGSQATWVEVGDLDGDGEVDDLVVARRLNGSITVALGDGSGGFSAPTNFSTGLGPVSLTIGDLDGDGSADDIAVVNYADDNVSVLLNDGSGSFAAQTTFAVGDNPRGVVIGDLDGDGANDIAVANNNETHVSVLSNDGSGSFSAQETFAVGTDGTGFTRGVAVGDLDGDGSANDLAVTNQSDNTVSVLIECFLTGTHILTDKGEVAVENLQIGDNVKTAEGKSEIIKWVGKQTIEVNQVANPLRGYPVLIKAGALGNNLPHNDLYVSPDHAMFVDGLLINAGALVNDLSIIKTEPNTTFTYYHVELGNHALLVAEGTAAESYLPQKENREQYDNCGQYEELYPQGSNLMLWPMDYPRISSCNKVPRFVSKKLIAIAEIILDQDIVDQNLKLSA